MRRIIEKLTDQDIADIDKRHWDQDIGTNRLYRPFTTVHNGARAPTVVCKKVHKIDLYGLK